MEYISSSFVRNLWGCSYADWCYVASRRALGGILLMWDRRVVMKIEGLMDLPLAGGTFTWSNTYSRSRIDHFLVSLEWEVRYPALIQKRMLRLCSNHFSILLDCDCMLRSKRPFKFENMWLKAYGFVDRLKALKANIKRRNEHEFGNVSALCKEKAEELTAMDRLEEGRDLGEEEKERKRVIISELETSLLQEEFSWRQKSRVQWLKEGDKCSKFFHRISNSNRRCNSSESLSINDSPSSNQTVIRDQVVQFYESLFSERCRWRPRLDNLDFDSLEAGEADQLEVPFEEREVLEVVKGKGSRSGCLLYGILPRLLGSDQGRHYGGFFRFLSSWMRRVVDRVISKPQNAFVKGRQIMDSVLIASESLDSRIRYGEPGLFCELDMEKTYDHIDWKFLLYLLKRRGFGEKWCSWIEHCISTKLSRVEAGDPLSLFLFVVVMEVLNRMIASSIDSGFISGFSVGVRLSERVNISHILFAYDTLVFCGANLDQVRSIKALLVALKLFLV
ncbi:uncharacterized protein LOC132162272 [Corylus avellana]|uniref:uncharacterized protein LOC132162272 n=1 Tax=Corylus avellana TaxID=13451 RepID=UPI00286A1243|nr:uncharacterized protein LOC132162272 [Corylus avellana]